MLTAPRPDPAPMAHDRVYRGLRARIMHGEIAPGRALTLRGIAAEYEVSMTPAREALRTSIAETLEPLLLGRCLLMTFGR